VTKRHERCSSLGLDVPIVTLTHGRLKKASIGSVLQTIVIAESDCNVWKIGAIRSDETLAIMLLLLNTSGFTPEALSLSGGRFLCGKARFENCF
jgi:hypothetical protein